MSTSNDGVLIRDQQAELLALQAMADSQIDYSDCPASLAEHWRDAHRGRFYRSQVHSHRCHAPRGNAAPDAPASS